MSRSLKLNFTMKGNDIMAVKSGVYPCYENQFAIGKSGTDTATTAIANCEEFSVAFDTALRNGQRLRTRVGSQGL